MSKSDPGPSSNDAPPDPRTDPARDSLRSDAGPDRAQPAEDTLGRDFADDDQDRMDLLVAMELETILPTPPKVPGIHFCWLADSQYDSIARRERAGYRPATPAQLPDWRCGGTRGTTQAGVFRVNEMVLYWIPEQAWQRYMRTVHHDKPIAEEQRLRVNVDLLANRVRERRFSTVELGDPIGPDVRPPPQSFQAA